MKVRSAIKWLLAKCGAQTLVGAALFVSTFIPDCVSRFQFWRDAAVGLMHNPWFPTAARFVLAAAGVGLVVMDVRSHLKGGQHNLVVTQIERGPLLYQEDHGYFIRRAAPPLSRRSIVLVAANIAQPRKKVESVGKIRAQLTLTTWDNRVEVVSPATWVGEFFSSVEINPGETRELIIAICFGDPDWRTVINRRGNAGEAISVNFEHEFPTGRGTMDVAFVSCDSGTVLTRYEFQGGSGLRNDGPK